MIHTDDVRLAKVLYALYTAILRDTVLVSKYNDYHPNESL